MGDPEGARFTVPAGEAVTWPVNLAIDRNILKGGVATASVVVQSDQQATRVVNYQVFGPGH